MNTTRSVALLLGGMLLVVWLPTVGEAAETARGKQAAKRAFERGEKLFRQGYFTDALDAFQRSHELFPHYLTLCNIARCHERRGKMTQALETYRDCLAKGASRAKQAARIRAAMEQVESQIAWVTVGSSQPGAAYVDGAAVGTTPVRVALDAGAHVIEVRRPGSTPATVQVRARGGDEREVQLDPTPLASSTPAVEPRTQPIGEQRRPLERRSDAAGGDEDEGLRSRWFWIGGATTLALAVAATVFSIQTVQRNGDYESEPTRARFDEVLDRRLLANVLWGLSAAGAITTTSLFFFTDFSRSNGATGESPRLSIVAAVRGRF